MLTSALFAALVAAFAPPPQCPAGQTPRGDLGIRAVACDCTVRAPKNGAPAEWRFRGLPTVTAIDTGGRASGSIEVGDEILAIDGMSLLTAEGAGRFANVPAGKSVTLRVRRAGREREVTLAAASLCSSDSRLLERRTPAAPPSPRADAVRPIASAVVPTAGMSLPWFGWALACSGCGWEQERGDVHPRWESSAPPVVHAVEPEGPAARAGIQPGDTLLEVGGVPITSAKGGALLGGAVPGQALALLMERGGRRFDVRLVTGAPRGRAAAARAPLPQRYRGRLGPAVVEVDSADPVTVSLSEDGTEILISTATTTVRMKMAGRK